MFNFGRWIDVFSDLQRRGCLQEKTRTGASFILGWLFDFVSRFMMLGYFIYLGYLKAHFMLIKYTCDSKSQTLRMRYPFQSTGRPISHQNGWSFLSWVKFSLRYNNRSELTLGWLVPAWNFVVAPCKQIESHEREPEWTCAGAKVAPVSCKHPLKA